MATFLPARTAIFSFWSNHAAESVQWDTSADSPSIVVVASLCKAAGIGGFKTNHSLRATIATRLYQAGFDEQLVMDRTGHRSVDGIRSYKRTSESQREDISNILNSNESKKICTSSLEATINTTNSAMQNSVPGKYMQFSYKEKRAVTKVVKVT